MSDERFDHDLLQVLREAAGEEAPMSLRSRLASITDEAPVSRRLWFSPPMRLSVAVVSAVAVLVLAFLLLPRDSVGPGPSESPGSPSPSVEASATPVPSADSTLQPTAVPTLSLPAWVGLDWADGIKPFPEVPPAAPGAFSQYTRIEDLLPFAGGYVGVGCATDDVTYREAAFMYSVDGQHWDLTARLSMGSDESDCPRMLVPLGNGLLAISAPHLWFTTDGHSWVEIDSPSWRQLWAASELMYPQLEAATSGPAGVVAVGNVLGGLGYSGKPIVAFSSDGVTWQEVQLPTDPAVVRDVVAYDGGFVIAGRDGEPDVLQGGGDPGQPVMPGYAHGLGAAAAWTSHDGRTWTLASVEGVAVPGGELTQVLVGADGLFAVGFNAAPSPQEPFGFTWWVSTDGATWRLGAELSHDLPGSPALASDGIRMLMLGTPSGADALYGWVSTDGVSWTPISFTGASDMEASQWAWESNGLLVRNEVSWISENGVILNGRRFFAYPNDDLFWFGTPVVR
jgi:hypothetical protein